jgi:streptogramin lyase
MFIILFIQTGYSQPSNIPNINQQFVTYQKQSNFIHEFDVPLNNQRGLKGITTDPQGNPWFYFQNSNKSQLMKFNLGNKTFNTYPVRGKTLSDTPVINLAGGQLFYDQNRNSIWFTDARVNALGKFTIVDSKLELTKIPTNNSGIMGIVLSPDSKTIWFSEITGNKIGSYDIESKTITEYPTGDFTGPTLLSFDPEGQLWITLSYANSVLKVQPWLLVPESRVGGIAEIKLEKPDTFSPFGVAISNNSNNSMIYVSDHGSSRVIDSNLTSELRNYVSYWTSPSQGYPASLPSQVVADKFGNIYFPEHGGNKISKISKERILTEYEIPTGPLATVVFIAASQDASKVWFTEWASNRIAYLDNALTVPLELKVHNLSTITLKANQSRPLDFTVTKVNNSSSSLFPNQIETSVVGMTDSGLQGITYVAKPQRFNLTNASAINGTVDLTVDPNQAVAGTYTIMPRISTLEKDNLTVSLLFPQMIKVDVPVHKAQLQKLPPSEINQSSPDITVILRDIARYASISVALTLIGYLVYRKIKQSKLKINK